MTEIDDIHPLTIISDRYSGCYSSGKYLAFYLEPWDVPREVDGSDRVCAHFWWSDDCKEFVIGKGDTPEKAIHQKKLTVTWWEKCNCHN